MAIDLKKVDFFGGQIIETVTGQSPVVIIKTIAASLLDATESAGPLNFNVAPSATNIPIQLGNITTAKALVMQADGDLNVSINGATPFTTRTLVLFNCSVSGINVSNPSVTSIVGVTAYAATSTD